MLFRSIYISATCNSIENKCKFSTSLYTRLIYLAICTLVKRYLDLVISHFIIHQNTTNVNLDIIYNWYNSLIIDSMQIKYNILLYIWMCACNMLMYWHNDTYMRNFLLQQIADEDAATYTFPSKMWKYLRDY